MKTQTLNTIAKRFFLGNILAAALFLSAQAKANTPKTSANQNIVLDSSSAYKLDLVYVGNSTEGLEFDVRYNNLSGKYFSFVIKDENGDVLFEQSYNNKAFYKKVQLPEVGEVKALTFTILNDKNKIVQTKEVKISTNLVQDVLVKIN
jgi:hypothetical protein